MLSDWLFGLGYTYRGTVVLFYMLDSALYHSNCMNGFCYVCVNAMLMQTNAMLMRACSRVHNRGMSLVCFKKRVVIVMLKWIILN